jgi:acyl dehydratase
MRDVYFEDLHVGMRFASEPEEVTQEAIVDFARMNDPQYFHVDPDAARTSLFGGLIASGWQTSSATLRHLLSRSGLTFVGGCVGVDTKISWKRPVRPGDCLHVEGEITALRASRSLADWGMVGFRSRTLDAAGVVVQVLDATMLVFRDPERRDRRATP